MLKRLLSLTFILSLGLAACRGGAAGTATLPPLPTLAPSVTPGPAGTATEPAPTATDTQAPTAAGATATVAPTAPISPTRAGGHHGTPPRDAAGGPAKAALVR